MVEKPIKMIVNLIGGIIIMANKKAVKKAAMAAKAEAKEAPKAEVKAEVKEAPKTEVKAEVKEAPKAEAKAEAKETPKAAAKKPAAKKTTKKAVKTNVYLQYAGKEIAFDEIVENVKKTVGDAAEITVYVKPEDNAAYYVADGNTGKIEM